MTLRENDPVVIRDPEGRYLRPYATFVDYLHQVLNWTTKREEAWVQLNSLALQEMVRVGLWPGSSIKFELTSDDPWWLLGELDEALKHADIHSDSNEQLDRIRDVIVASRQALEKRKHV